MKTGKRLSLTIALFVVMIAAICVCSISYADKEKFQSEYTRINDSFNTTE